MDHDRRREDVAQRPADAEVAILAIAGQPGGAQRARHRGDGEFRDLDLEHRQRGLHVEAGERGRVTLGALEGVERLRDQSAGLLQAGDGPGIVQRAGRGDAAGAAHHCPGEGLCAVDGGGRDPGPGARPQDVRDRRHGLVVDVTVAGGEHLLRQAAGLEAEAAAARAAHAERLPAAQALQGVILLEEDAEHLVGRPGLGRAAGDGHDAVGLGAVGDHGGGPFQGDRRAVGLDGGGGGADIAAALALGRRRGHQELLVGDATQQPVLPGLAASVPDQAGDLGLVHGEDHRRGGAGSAQPVGDLGERAHRGALPAECDRHGRAQQALRAQGGDGFLGEATVAVHGLGMGGGDRGGDARTGQQVGGTVGESVRPGRGLHGHGGAP